MISLAIFHQLDLSGAPLVGLDVVSRWAEAKNLNIKIAVPRSTVSSALGGKSFGGGLSVVEHPTSRKLPYEGLRNVYVNSIAVPKRWLNQVLDLGLQQRLEKIVLYVHENEPDLYLDAGTSRKIKRATEAGVLQVFVPSAQTKLKVQELHGLGISSKLALYRVENQAALSASQDTSELKIAVVGPSHDTRKRQQDVVKAAKIAQEITGGLPHHRNIKLNLIGLSKGGLTGPILDEGQDMHSGSLTWHHSLPQEEVHGHLAESNVVVSLSDNESLGIYLVEAMLGGALVLRTQVGGYLETLSQGVNGYSLDGSHIQLAETLQFLANTTKFPDSVFRTMMDQSKRLAKGFTDQDYLAIISEFNNSKESQ